MARATTIEPGAPLYHISHGLLDERMHRDTGASTEYGADIANSPHLLNSEWFTELVREIAAAGPTEDEGLKNVLDQILAAEGQLPNEQVASTIFPNDL